MGVEKMTYPIVTITPAQQVHRFESGKSVPTNEGPFYSQLLVYYEVDGLPKQTACALVLTEDMSMQTVVAEFTRAARNLTEFIREEQQ